MISGIDDVAYDAGYSVMVFQSNESYNREVIATESLLNNRVDGILISITKETRQYNHLQRIIDREVPLVLFDRVCDEIDTDKVIVDDYHGSYHATKHLIQTGCKRIAHFAGPPGLKLADLRRNGYMEALRDHNMKIERDLLVFCDNYKHASIRTRQLLSSLNPPDAILAVNELTATGIIKTAKEMGVGVPEKLSVIGFTDSLISQVIQPTLTSIDQHGYEIGQMAVQILLDRMLGTVNHPDRMVKEIKTTLVIRESTRRL